MDNRLFSVGGLRGGGCGGVLDLAARGEDFISCWHFHSVNSLFMQTQSCAHRPLKSSGSRTLFVFVFKCLPSQQHDNAIF